MCRWLAYCGEPIYLDELLFEREHSLIRQSLHARRAPCATQGDGFGLGWYGERPTPGTYHEILPAWNDRNLRSLAHQIRARLFLAHVRASTGTTTSRTNCHPFVVDRWMFMHNGQIGGYEKVRRRIDNLIPDSLYARRMGTTDSEAMFHAMFRHGIEQDPVAALRIMLREVRAEMAAAGVNEPLKFTSALSDGERVIAVRHASDDQPPTLFWCERDGQLTVVSEPLDADECDWHPVPPDHVLVSRGAGTTELLPLAL
jgi:predicted glutamine amidotransferase